MELEFVPLEELYREGFDCYGFVTVAALKDYEAHLPEDAKTAYAKFERHGYTVYFLGVKILRGKALAQAELEKGKT